MIFFFFLSLVFSQPQLADGVIAVVGNQPILLSSVKDEVDLLAQEKKIKTSSSLYLSLFDSVLEKNINNKIILSFAKADSSLIVSYEEIKQILDERLAFYLQKFGSILAFEKAVGMSVLDMKEKNWKTIEEELLIEKYRIKNFKNVKITKHDVLAFFDEFKDSLNNNPSFASFSFYQKKIEPSLSNKKGFLKKTDLLIDSLRLGLLDFSEVALKRSIDPSAQTNKGVLTTMRGDLVPEYEKTAFSLKEGEIGGLTESSFGFHVIKLLEKRGEKIKTQHILLSLPITKEDVVVAKNNLKQIQEKTLNDPGVFDSLCVSLGVGFSGSYENKTLESFPLFVEAFLKEGQNYSFSEIIKKDGYFSLLYKYSFNGPEKKNLKNSWFEIENLALNKKRFEEFDLWIKEKKENMYIFISDF